MYEIHLTFLGVSYRPWQNGLLRSAVLRRTPKARHSRRSKGTVKEIRDLKWSKADLSRYLRSLTSRMSCWSPETFWLGSVWPDFCSRFSICNNESLSKGLLFAKVCLIFSQVLSKPSKDCQLLLLCTQSCEFSLLKSGHTANGCWNVIAKVCDYWQRAHAV